MPLLTYLLACDISFVKELIIMDIQKLLDDFNSALSEPVYDKIELPLLMLAEYNEAVSEKKTKRSYYLDSIKFGV